MRPPSGAVTGLRLILSGLLAIDDETVNSCPFGQILHATMNLRQHALVDDEVTDFNVVNFQRST